MSTLTPCLFFDRAAVEAAEFYASVSEAVSFQVHCADQAEVDRYWEALVQGGGEHGRCGWLKDRFGLSWQVIPRQMTDYIGGSDPAGCARAMEAMITMSKLDIDALRRAYEGTGRRRLSARAPGDRPTPAERSRAGGPADAATR